MAINNKSYLTKAFIFLFSLITEIYNNCIKQTFEKSVNNCNFVCQQTKLVDTDIILKKVMKFVQDLIPCHLWRTLFNCILINLWKKIKIKNNSNYCFNEHPCPTQISALLTQRQKKSLFLQIPRIVVSYLVPIPTSKNNLKNYVKSWNKNN